MTFATKPRLARAMIERAIAAGVPFGWVAGAHHPSFFQAAQRGGGAMRR
jgi:hypothetical protein